LAAQRSGDNAEVHYWLAASARGQGLASRALGETVEWIGAAWPGVVFVCLHIRSGNDASVRVADRVGFVRDEARDKTIQVRGEDWLMTAYTLSLQQVNQR
jgi:[ribosomal protein S5]-alanine N-acetyltransferase